MKGPAPTMRDRVDALEQSMLALTLREKIEAMEQAMLVLPQIDCPVRHYFAPGVFAREMTIPAGTVVTGAVHKTENLVVLSSGVLGVMTEEGPVLIRAPYIMAVKPGAKNCVVALEDAVWTNVFANPSNEQDIDLLIESLCEAKAEELLGGAKNLQLLANKAGELAATEAAQIEGV